MKDTPSAVYMPKRTFLVTAHTLNNTYLVRGNEPLNEDGSFAYEAINAKLKDLVPGFGLTKLKFIVISLIDNNPESERGDLEKEFNGYGISSNEFDTLFPWPGSWPPVYQNIDVTKQYGTQVNGHPGSIIWYPVQGCSDQNNCALVEPSQFNFSGLVDYLNTLITTEKDAVIYYHCEHGHDRTSALTAAYMLKYMHRTIDEVLNDKPPIGAKAFKHDWETNYEELVKYYYSTL